jgi:hypothetical protein
MREPEEMRRQLEQLAAQQEEMRRRLEQLAAQQANTLGNVRDAVKDPSAKREE